jgi:hypothetical protein
VLKNIYKLRQKYYFILSQFLTNEMQSLDNFSNFGIRLDNASFFPIPHFFVQYLPYHGNYQKLNFIKCNITKRNVVGTTLNYKVA